jgi:mannose-6-phosphate isomerase-like protein (cupin superfamily)
VVRIYLPGGASALPVKTPGPLVIVVERGELTIGGPRDEDRGYPYRVTQGEQATVPAGVRIRPRNETDTPLTFLAVAFIPLATTQEASR